ncbi:MAG: hypothetical protein Q8N08_04025 [Methanobacteriaceae archaeon]|nr:hypothetical protein [Methanobacteriaceae archaeon]
MEYTAVIKLFRELCGDYNPEETANERRFLLATENYEVPIFVETEHPVVYPQIQISPFISEKEIFEDEQWEDGPGIAPFEIPEINYIKSNTVDHIKDARFALDILGKNDLEVYEIKKALQARYWKFINAHIGEFYDPDNFVEIEIDEVATGVYSTNEYNSNLVRIARVEEIIDDSRQILTKVNSLEEVMATQGSWFLSETDFYVYPVADMDNMRFIEIIHGFVLSDGLCTKEKGLKQIIVRTSAKGYDTDPDVDRWTMMLELRFSQREIKDIGRSFAEVEVDE